MASKLDSALGDYLRAIKQYALLTPEEECELGRKIRDAAEAEERLARDEIGLREHEQIQREAAEARDRMVHANLRLVISVAKNFRNRGLPMEDLVEEGNVGLMNAVDRFDPAVGSRFSTYASYWIDQAIRRAVQNASQMIHIPSYLMEQIGHLRLAMRELE
ncbi:MAG: sigma-70 family RNA polymerase sigma factor [Phycisphaerae bacterium]